MKSTPRDYSIFDKFGFERKPVGVKFVPLKPEGFARLDKRLSFCEMFKEAQESDPFYVGREDFFCIEPIVLGMEDPDPGMTSGLVGETDDLFQEARANRKLYQYMPKMVKGSVKYVIFCGIDQLTFDPDVLIVTAPAEEAQPLMRAITYSNGEMWSSKGTPAAACSWMYVYPVVSGEVNFTITGLSLGMQALEIFPPGLMIISIPWTKLPMIIDNLQTMSWKLISQEVTKDAHKERVDKLFEELKQKMRE